MVLAKRYYQHDSVGHTTTHHIEPRVRGEDEKQPYNVEVPTSSSSEADEPARNTRYGDRRSHCGFFSLTVIPHTLVNILRMIGQVSVLR